MVSGEVPDSYIFGKAFGISGLDRSAEKENPEIVNLADYSDSTVSEYTRFFLGENLEAS